MIPRGEENRRAVRPSCSQSRLPGLGWADSEPERCALLMTPAPVLSSSLSITPPSISTFHAISPPTSLTRGYYSATKDTNANWTINHRWLSRCTLICARSLLVSTLFIIVYSLFWFFLPPLWPPVLEIRPLALAALCRKG